MVNATTVKGLAARLEKAESLVESGAVFPVAGMTGYSVVRNGGGDSMYLVRHDAGHEHCTCPDYRQRQQSAGLPCKHILAAQLALSGTTQPTPPVVAVDPVKIETARALGIMAPAKAAA